MFELIPFDRKNHLSNYNPFRELEEFERNFWNGHTAEAFKTDIKDAGNAYELEADLPGFDKKDIHLDISGDTLTVHAERRSKVEEKDKKDKIIRMERSYGSYSRQFDVSGIDTEKIKAKYENGVLKLTMPKKEADLPASKQLMIE